MSAPTCLGLMFLTLFAACDGSSSGISDDDSERSSPSDPLRGPELIEPDTTQMPPDMPVTGVPLAGFLTKPMSIGVFIDQQGAPEPVRVAFVDYLSLSTESILMQVSEPIASGEGDVGLWARWDSIKDGTDEKAEGAFMLFIGLPNGDGSKAYYVDPASLRSHPNEDPEGKEGVHIHFSVSADSRIPHKPLDLQIMSRQNWPQNDATPAP